MYESMSDAELIDALSRSAAQNQLLSWAPYGWQQRFHDAGKFATQRMIMAANGVGKSQTICAEVSMHATGQYPTWWEGYRLERGGFEIWIGAIDNDMQKRGPQRALMGRDLEGSLGTGLLPGNAIVEIQLRQAGVKSVCDTVTVRHTSGENVVIKWLTYEQGWRKWQSGDPKIILLDEEPDESNVDQKDILSEILTRLVRNSGILLVGYTPLLGDTQLTLHFTDSKDPAVYYVTATWDDAPHMDEVAKELIKSQYPAHQKDARSRGIPMLGEGRIFDTSENMFLIDPIPIPDHWARLKGVDFGIAHPAAKVSLAHDRDTDTVYLYEDWKDEGVKLRDHAHVVNSGGDWIPVSWPHDGEKRDPDSGKQFHKIYRTKYNVNMLSQSARYDSKKGGAQAQWPIIETLIDRLDSNRFKVFRTCTSWLQEYRSYHTKNGLIVARRDDCLKASFYALMMLRFAVSKSEAMRAFAPKVQAAPFTTAVH